MGLSRLDNFLKNSRGDILYVDPSSIDSTDSIENQGNSLVRPFKTIQRALIEAARFSYQVGLDNDRFSRTTVIVYPGEHLIDNRPGWIPIHDNPVSGNNWLTRGGAYSNALEGFNLDTNFDVNSENNSLYKMNSVYGGVIIPRGTSIVGLDLRKTKIRPKFVPNPQDDTVDSTCLFRVTGTCYFNQFTFFDADPNSLVYKDYGLNLSVPNYSHHKLTCFEYADGVNPVAFDNDDLNYNTTKTDLDLYYEKIALVYGPSSGREISPVFPSVDVDIQSKIDEYRIVGSIGQNIGITSIRSGDGINSSNIITVDILEPINGLDVDTPIRIEGIPASGYNGSFVIRSVEDPTTITYTVSSPPVDPLPTIIAGSPTLNISVDTVTSASPYIFNCSLRSVYGMNGLHADGSKSDGFRSMVIAQFTAIGLQKDDNAFVKYNPISGAYEDSVSVPNLHTNSLSIYKPSYDTFHIKASNNAFLQLVSVFSIGFGNHYISESGGDLSITNSNSNFGAKALVCKGFRKDAFPRDDAGYITHILPPQAINSQEITVEYGAIDVETTIAQLNNTRLYLYNELNRDIPPKSVIEGYRIGSKFDDRLKVVINNQEKSASIIMPDTQGSGIYECSSFKIATVGRTNIGINSISSNILTLTEPHLFESGETIRIFSDDGELPDGISNNNVYYAITSGINNDQIKLARTLDDSVSESAVTVNNKGGILTIESRVSDKKSGDIGHPVQYDESVGQWYITVSSVNNDIYSTITSLGFPSLGKATSKTYISRTPDNRSLDSKIYKVRYVIPKDSTVISRPPEDSFVLQESNTTSGFSDSEVAKFMNISAVTLSNTSELRNPRFISNAIHNPAVGIATIFTDTAHQLSIGSKVEIKNVISSNNITGIANTGYNGIYDVLDTPTRKSFSIGITTSTGIFRSNINIRNLDLPIFKRKELDKTFWIYKTEEIQDYIPNSRDGVYHLTIIDSSSSPTVNPFTDLKFSQPLKNLYPQLDRDNPENNPNKTRTFALPTPIGLTEIDNPQNSLTREVIENTISSFNYNIGILDIHSQTGSSHTITTKPDHGLNRVTKVSIINPGINYGDGSGGVQVLYNASLIGAAGSVVGKHATANVEVDVNGSITNVKIVDGGSAYGIGNTLTVVGVGTTTGWVAGYVVVDQIYDNTGDVLKLSGLRDSRFGEYNNLYRITNINVGDDHNITVSSASTIYSHPAYGQREVISGVNTDGLININTSILSDVTLYLTGQSIGINSTFYNNITGITTITTNNSHGLLVGNKIVVSDVPGIDQYNKTYYVRNVINNNTIDVFSGAGVTSLLPASGGYIYPVGFDDQQDIIDIDKEYDSSRLVARYAGITTTSTTLLGDPAINTIAVTNATHRGWEVGDYIIVNKEIMRINQSVINDTSLSVFRGLFGTRKDIHPAGSVIRRVKFIPTELRRNSIIRASGHTFEYLGYGPGNYSTALPSRQDRQFKNIERILSQSSAINGGTPFYNGLDDKGNAYTVNKFTSGSTGTDLLTNAPIPTVRGEDITSDNSSVGYDILSTEQLTVNRGIKVDGGKDNNIISEFNGPTIFNEKVTVKDSIEGNSILIQGDQTISREISIGIGTPEIAGNIGDSKINAEPKDGGTFGWVYTDNNTWNEFGPIKTTADNYYVGLWSGTFRGDGSGLANVSDVWVFDGVGISTTTNVGIETTSAKPGYSLYAAGPVLFENNVEFRSEALVWNIEKGWIVETGISTFNQQVNFNTSNHTGVSTFINRVIISTNPQITGGANELGQYVTFRQTDQALTNAYLYGGINFEGNDVGNSGVRGYIRGASEGAAGQFALVFGTQESGASNPQERLRISGAGNATFSGTVTANSDERLKENVVGIGNALSKVLDLRGVYFNRVGQPEREIGLIAQEVENVLPELVFESPDGVKSVAYQNMVAVLIEAIKEQQEQINELKARLDSL